MKYATTLLVLLFAGVINLCAQTANEAAWQALPDQQDPKTAASPQAAAIAAAIMAGDSVTSLELQIVNKVARTKVGDTAWRADFRTLAGSDKTGIGTLMAKAQVKQWDRDFTGWTDQMIASKVQAAAALAVLPEAPQQFKDQVWKALQTQAAHDSRKFWKQYRSTLPKPAQVAATQRQKDLAIALPERNENATAWLAEMTADLIAMSLDTPAAP